MSDEPKDTESMVERVARVIELALERYGVTDYEGTIDDAVVAITAMREPTKAMLQTTEEIVVGYDDFACGDGTLFMSHAVYEFESEGRKIVSEGHYDSAIAAWQAMIDAALAGGRP